MGCCLEWKNGLPASSAALPVRAAAVEPWEGREMADASDMPDIKVIRTQLFQIMNGDNRTGVDDATRSLLYALMQIVEKLESDVEYLKAKLPN